MSSIDSISVLKQAAQTSFARALERVNAESAVENAIKIDAERLIVGTREFDRAAIKRIYAVALGKAATAMALGLQARANGELFAGGVISAPQIDTRLTGVWQQAAGGHPVPNRASLNAARRAFTLLAAADAPDALVIFLVSGGGSAMMELPADDAVSLADLQTTNEILVNCGAPIGEINAVRRRLSLVKAGGLARVLRRAQHFTLIVSDTNENEAYNVASGPTVASAQDFTAAEIAAILDRYRLDQKLPPSVLECLDKSLAENAAPPMKNDNWQVLLSNSDAVEAAAQFLAEKNFAVEVDRDLVETDIGAGCAGLIEKLLAARQRETAGKFVAIVSGGEFACPVHDARGRGGRSTEAALRTAIRLDELSRRTDLTDCRFAALFAGTDGADGNSGAAGAICDSDTLARAQEQNLNAEDYLARSDSHSFFAALGDSVETGKTGTNVRDIRVLLATPKASA